MDAHIFYGYNSHLALSFNSQVYVKGKPQKIGWYKHYNNSLYLFS